jgi:hypothetical protein
MSPTLRIPSLRPFRSRAETGVVVLRVSARDFMGEVYG